MRPIQLYAIAPGSNVALVSLVNLETITATNDTRPFGAVQAIWSYSPGAAKVRLDSLGHRAGFPAVGWLHPAQTRLQYDYSLATWTPIVSSTGDGFSGLVTIYTTLGGLTYYRCNATLFIPAMVETPDSHWYADKQVLWQFTHIVKL